MLASIKETTKYLFNLKNRALKSHFCIPIDNLSLPLTCDHVQQRLSQVVSDAAVANHLVPEYDEAQVVHILHVVLLNIDPVLGDKRKGRNQHQTTVCTGKYYGLNLI